VEEAEEAEEVEVEEVAAVEAFPAATTPKEATITTTTTKVPLVLPLLLLVLAMPHKEVKEAKEEHDVSLVDDSEEVEEEVVKEVMVKATKVETKPVELQTTTTTTITIITTTTTTTTTTTKVVPLALEVAVHQAPEEDVLPDVNLPTEHHRTPLCSLRISHSDSMTKDFQSCSKTKRSPRPTLLKTEMEDLKASVLSNSTMRLTKKQLWTRAQSCQRKEES